MSFLLQDCIEDVVNPIILRLNFSLAGDPILTQNLRPVLAMGSQDFFTASVSFQMKSQGCRGFHYVSMCLRTHWLSTNHTKLKTPLPSHESPAQLGPLSTPQQVISILPCRSLQSIFCRSSQLFSFLLLGLHCVSHLKNHSSFSPSEGSFVVSQCQPLLPLFENHA